jgi:hypothetical protein
MTNCLIHVSRIHQAPARTFVGVFEKNARYELIFDSCETWSFECDYARA